MHSIFEHFFPLRQHAVMCYLASSSIPGTRINFLVSWFNLDKGGGGGRYHRRPFQQQMIKTSPFLEFQIDRSLFRMKGGIWEEFYHFWDHQLIKTDEIVGHRESWTPLADNSSRRLRCWDVDASTRISSFVLINNDLLDWGNDMKWDSFLQQLTL